MDKLAKFRPFLEKARLQAAEDRAAGRARFGGKADFFRASTERAYSDAAKVLIDHALAQKRPDNLVQPAVFLLRHAVELELKKLICAAWDIEEMRQSIDAGQEVTSERSKRDQDKMTDHPLVPLLNLLVKVLKPLRLEVPSGLASLARELHDFDAGDVTRTRYSRGMRDGYKHASYPEQVVADLRSWLDRLQHYHTTDGNLRADCSKCDDFTFVEELAMWQSGLDQQMYASGLLTLEDEKLNEDD